LAQQQEPGKKVCHRTGRASGGHHFGPWTFLKSGERPKEVKAGARVAVSGKEGRNMDPLKLRVGGTIFLPGIFYILLTPSGLGDL